MNQGDANFAFPQDEATFYADASPGLEKLLSVPKIMSAPSKPTMPSTMQTSSFGGVKNDEDNDSEQDNQNPKPKRPLSSYNFFFQTQRQLILDETPTRPEGKPRRSHGKIGFAPLARIIAARWKSIDADTRKEYDDMAAQDKARYQVEMEEWKKNQKNLEERKMREASLNVMHGSHLFAPQRNLFSMDQNCMSSPMAPGSFFGAPAPTPTQSGVVCVSDILGFVTSEAFPPNAPSRPMDPAPVASPEPPQIAVLARTMDNDCVDMLVNLFGS